MKEETLLVTDRQQWRQWLSEEGGNRPEIWLIYHKKHTGKPRIPYDDAVEEALCFGWIDSTVRRIDEDRFMQRFTPRRPKSNWSALNRRRAESMLKQGLVKAPGLACIEEAKANGNWDAAGLAAVEIEMPQELAQALKANQKARVNFSGLSASNKKKFLGWVAVAKRPETRERRAKEAVGLLAQGKSLGMK